MSMKEILAESFPEYFRNDPLPERVSVTSKVSEVSQKTELAAYIAGMDKLVNSKTKLAMWIVDKLNSQELSMSQRDIAKATGISLGTVESTMKILQEGDVPFLIKSDSGAYRLNPEIRGL